MEGFRELLSFMIVDLLYVDVGYVYVGISTNSNEKVKRMD